MMLQMLVHLYRREDMQRNTPWEYFNYLAKGVHAQSPNFTPTDVHKVLTCPKPQKRKLTICGRRIWVNLDLVTMPPKGWLQFSVLAKDCRLDQAMMMCRTWAELAQLSFLASCQYFPVSKWAPWEVDVYSMYLHELVSIVPPW